MALYLEQGEELTPGAAARPVRAGPARGPPRARLLLLRRDGRRRSRSCSMCSRELDAQPGRGQPAAVSQGRGRPTAERVAVAPDPSKHVIAHVFKVTHRPVRRQARHLPRTPGHGAQPGAQLLVGDARKPIKVAHSVPAAGQGPRRGRAGDPGRHLRGAEDRRAAFRRGAARLARRGSSPPEVGGLPARRCWGSRSAARNAATSRSCPRRCTGLVAEDPVRPRRASRGAERDRALRARRPAPAGDARSG